MAEALEQRRAPYKPQSKTRPSTTHLFAEPQLTEFIKKQGGVSKVFPGKLKKPNVEPRGKHDIRQKPSFQRQNYHNSEERASNQQHGSNLRKTREDRWEVILPIVPKL